MTAGARVRNAVRRLPTAGAAAPAAQGPRAATAWCAGRETKGRKGAGVTVVTGVPLDEAGLRELAAALKKSCGSGGTLKDGVIEVQGDHRDRIVALLQGRGGRSSGWAAEGAETGPVRRTCR